MRWGDVLIAAIDACCAAGPDAEVQPEKLAEKIEQLTARSGGMESVRAMALVNRARTKCRSKPDPNRTPDRFQARAFTSDRASSRDSPMLPELLDQIPADVELGTVTADGPYDTRRCHDAFADRGADAVIPPRKHDKPWSPSTAGAIARNEAIRASK